MPDVSNPAPRPPAPPFVSYLVSNVRRRVVARGLLGQPVAPTAT